jgi:hypothetical protein
MPISTPDWLTLRGGELRPSKDALSCIVVLNGQPQYLVIPIPAGGKFACRVSQTVNGHRFDKGATFASLDEAMRGGLDDLRQALGW